MFENVFNQKGLSLERLHLLCEVARAGGIRAAVGEDLARQSLASRQLKSLSEYVGVELCTRVGRNLEMTKAGQRLTEISNEFFSKITSFLNEVNGSTAELKIGVGDALFQWYILPLLSNEHRTRFDAQLIPFSCSTSQIIRQVSSAIFDAGIIRHSSSIPTNLMREQIGKISYRLFVPQKFIDANPTPDNLPVLKNIPFCTLTGNGEYSQNTATFLSSFNSTARLHCSSMTQMALVVRTGQYAAILPDKASVEFINSPIASYTLPELEFFTRSIDVIYRSETKNEMIFSIIKFLNNIFNGYK